jgi:hypothetical protein
MTLIQRVKGAARILFGRGDNATCCSFCGKAKLSGETIIAGPGVAICGSCAHLSLNMILLRDDAPAPQGSVMTEVMPLAEPSCLLPSCRETLEADLAAAAHAVSAVLLGWSYTRSAGGSDYLSVRVGHAGSESGETISARFIAAFLQREGTAWNAPSDGAL